MTLHVVLVDLKSDVPSPPYQLGLLVAYAMLEPEIANNIRFTFSSHPQDEPFEDAARSLLGAEADVLAFSNYSWNYKKTRQILRWFESSGAKLPRILMGGPNCAGSFGLDLLKQFSAIDAIVEGEGEPAFRDICASLVDSPTRDPFAKARNTRTRTEGLLAPKPNLGHRIARLDDVPSPYLTGLLPVEPAPLLYETNRGCPYRCAFCYWGNGTSKVYRMSAERVREELAFFARHRVGSLILADANFGIFEEDQHIAELMAEINTAHGNPLHFLSVNYAKNSGERVIQIASALRRGNIFTATTLALQSLTPEAEKQAKRYAIKTGTFVGLVRAADRQNIATYTDLILGLPGESIEEFEKGLVSAIASGVPAIKIYRLSLLPGTEFYDHRDQLGLAVTTETDLAAVSPEDRPENWEFLVRSNPRMSHVEMQRGLRLIAVNHILHNHNLGTIVGFYLARYGLCHLDVYSFFDRLLQSDEQDLPERSMSLLQRLRTLIRAFANTALDAYVLEGELGNELWFGGKGFRAQSNEPELRAFMQDFFAAFSQHHDIATTDDERALLLEVADYNVLVAPKPRWKPLSEYRFEWDIHGLWKDLHEQVLAPSPAGDQSWGTLAGQVADRVRTVLTADRLERARGPVRFRVENPMPFLPPKLKFAWAVTNREWFCRFERVGSGRTSLDDARQHGGNDAIDLETRLREQRFETPQ